MPPGTVTLRGMSLADQYLAELKGQREALDKAIVALEALGGKASEPAPKPASKPASKPARKAVRKTSAKVACAVCGKKYVAGTGMSAHIRAQHPDKK